MPRMIIRAIHILILSLISLFIFCKHKTEVDNLYRLIDVLGYDKDKCLLILHESSCLGCVRRGVEIINDLDPNKIQLLYIRRHELSEPIFDIKFNYVCLSEIEFYRLSGIKNIRNMFFKNGVLRDINTANILLLEELLECCD